MVFNAVESRYIIADSIVCFSSNVEQLSTGESAPENSRVINVYTIKGPSYINAGVKARVRYVTGGQILSISTYGVCSYGSCSWVPNLVTFVPVGTRYALKVSGTLSFSDDLASMLGKTEQYVNNVLIGSQVCPCKHSRRWTALPWSRCHCFPTIKG